MLKFKMPTIYLVMQFHWSQSHKDAKFPEEYFIQDEEKQNVLKQTK